MVRTKKIQLTNKTFFKTLLSVYLKKRWWLILFILIIAILSLFNRNEDTSNDFLIYFGFIYPPIILLQFWRFANSKDNKIFLLERDYEIDNEKIIGNLSDGTSSTIMNNLFIKTIQLKKTYLLYISKTQFIYIPKDAFLTEQDKNWFEKEIVRHIKKH
jgi:hypothetical protein